MADERGSEQQGDHQDQPRTKHDGLRLRAGRDQVSSKGLTRRRFLQTTAAGAAGMIIAPYILKSPAAHAAARGARVVRAFHAGATSGWDTVNQEPVDLMVHAAIRALTGHEETGAAWKSLFPGINNTHKVAIKINLACGDVPTHPEVVNAIIDGLLMMDLGGQQLPEEQIIVWDFDNPFFCPQTGYTPNWGGPGVQYVGTDHPSVGYDSQTFVIDHPLNTHSYHQFSKIIIDHCDYMINASVIKDHSESGITFSLKNLYGTVNGISTSYQMHLSGTYGDGHTRGEPGLARFLRDDLGDKTKLYIIDGTFGLYNGGPGYIPPYHTPPNWAYNSVIVGIDPVATDRIGTIKINEERAKHGLGALNPSMLPAAAGDPYYLGTDDPELIDLIELNVEPGADVPGSSLGSKAVALLAPYPNPAGGACTLRFHCATESHAELVIVDVRGSVVRRVADAHFTAGMHRFHWDGCDDRGRALPSGIYFCKLRTGLGTRRQRVVFIR
ncbi:MAG: DUF362 domain-containing protein [Candidatus Eisenbacteria bacterium]|uniref:DUF362 domain-containing protein n=1 Tax=Eiseniibacteriota bacterium TaxID=2212470 RepID=A0A948RXZ6_UNCEI|nr:DUF362 domain-containing protein [Candidatus Eisenbacteria bacterium]MBU2692026.1 DUF362 domain-containing protein [Candidatus Eisenbacteria bacterium]